MNFKPQETSFIVFRYFNQISRLCDSVLSLKFNGFTSQSFRMFTKVFSTQMLKLDESLFEILISLQPYVLIQITVAAFKSALK